MGNEEDFHFGDLRKFLKTKPEVKDELDKKMDLIKKHPIVQEFTEMMDELYDGEEKVEKEEKLEPVTITCEICLEEIPPAFYDDHFAKCKTEEKVAERIAEGIEIQHDIKEVLDKIELIERNWDLEILQKLITVKNVLNYSQSTWSLGVCNEILGEGSLRGGKKTVGAGLIRTIKKICKIR